MELINHFKCSTTIEIYLEQKVLLIFDGAVEDIGNNDQIHDAAVVDSIEDNNIVLDPST